jgi:hypothetical protein
MASRAEYTRVDRLVMVPFYKVELKSEWRPA